MLRTFTRYALALACLLLPINAALAQNSESDAIEIRVSYQPAFWALPWFIAGDKGWWADFGLKPELKLFASGAPQVAAGASGEWDVGGAGDIPAVLGGSKYGLLNIAISDIERAILTLTAASEDAAKKYMSDPSNLEGKEIPVTLNSNGERVTVACLEKLGANPDSYKLVNLAPADINVAMRSGRFDLAGVWAPNTYILEEAIGAKVICRGSDTDLYVTGRLFVTPGYAEENPEAVARFLALYFHGIEWQKAHPDETLAYLKKFYDSMGIKVPEKNLPDEVTDHPQLGLDEQLDLYSRSGSEPSEVDTWSNNVAEFLAAKGSIPSVPAAEDYITDRFLKMVADDPELSKRAREAE